MALVENVRVPEHAPFVRRGARQHLSTVNGFPLYPGCAGRLRGLDSKLEMCMAKRVLLVSAIMAVAVALSSAQVSSQGSMGGTITATGSFSGSASFSALPPFAPNVVTGAPYSGEEVNENIQVLTDGTRITHKNMGRKVWRDGSGRTRTERPLGMGTHQASMPVIVEITDPVAGYKYTLDTQNKVAHRQALPAPGSRPTGFRGGTVGSGPSAVVYGSVPVPAPTGGGSGGRAGDMVPPPMPSSAGAPMQPRFPREPVGPQSIEGVLAEGTRSTTTYPVGMMGNDREFTVVSESWMSPDLKVQILAKTNDPRNGESTFHMQDLSRTPPDAMLFTVPPDYTVVDEAGSFTITFKGQ